MLLITTKACTFSSMATECLSSDRLNSFRDQLSYKRPNLGYGSTRSLFQTISMHRDRAREKITKGQCSQKFLNLWCPPCCHMIKTAEVIVNELFSDGQEPEASIYIDPMIPASCCQDTTILPNKFLAIRQAIDNSDASTESSQFDVRPSYNYKHIEQLIEQFRTPKGSQSSTLAGRSNFLERIKQITNQYAHHCGYSVSIILAEADIATKATTSSDGFLPFSRPFGPNECFKVNQADLVWNPNGGLFKDGSFEWNYKFWYDSTWS